MEVITKDLQSLAMAITMDMDNLMSTRTVIITMDLTDMKLSMITRRDLLRPNQDMDMEDTATSTKPLRALLKVIMARDLLSLVMVITMHMDNLMSTRTAIIIMDLMDTRLSMIIGRDLLMLDMKEKVTSMSTDPTLTTQLRYTTQKLITATIKL